MSNQSKEQKRPNKMRLNKKALFEGRDHKKSDHILLQGERELNKDLQNDLSFYNLLRPQCRNVDLTKLGVVVWF